MAAWVTWSPALRLSLLPNIQQEESQQLSCILEPNQGIKHNCCCWQRQWKPNCTPNWKGGNVDKEKQPTKSQQDKQSLTRFCHQSKQCARFPKTWMVSVRMDQETRCKRAGLYILTTLMLSGIFFPPSLKIDHKAMMQQTDCHDWNTCSWA